MSPVGKRRKTQPRGLGYLPKGGRPAGAKVNEGWRQEVQGLGLEDVRLHTPPQPSSELGASVSEPPRTAVGRRSAHLVRSKVVLLAIPAAVGLGWLIDKATGV